MKKMIIFALVALLGVQYADAQQKNRKTRTPEQMVENLDKKLNLTDEQEKQVLQLYTEFFAKKQSKEVYRKAMQELNDQVMSLLDDKQKEIYKQMKGKRTKRSK